MDNMKMGKFIAELRKTQQLTQKELADKLNISDKAVSKWERGISCPDISLLSPLSDVLGITTTELLNGERGNTEDANVEKVVVNALEYAEEAGKRRVSLNLNVVAAVYSIFLLIGIFVTVIVDAAISGALTWSLIPISSCVFAWLVFIPAIKLGSKGIIGSLISATVFTAPYLFALDYAVDRLLEYDTIVFSLGIRLAPFAIVFIWISFILYKLFKKRILLAVATTVLLVSPLSYIINAVIGNMTDVHQSSFEVVLNTLTPVVVAAVIFVVEFILKKKKTA